MTVVCLTNLGIPTGAASGAEAGAPDRAERVTERVAELGTLLLERAPRVRMEAGTDRGQRPALVWADARGLEARSLAEALLGLLRAGGVAAPRAGIASTPVAAEIAARHPAPPPDSAVIEVPPDEDRAFLAPQPLAVLGPEPDLLALLDGTGLERCGDLAALDQASVEVRFGAGGVALWRLARADDRRLLFGAAPRPLPHASLEWTDYTLHDAERLLFVVNRLVGSVCTALRQLGQGARAFTVSFALVRGQPVEHTFRPSRPSADATAWVRLVRHELERLRLPDGATGIAVRVDAVDAATSVQGDLLDRGFATAREAEAALARVLERDGVLLLPESTRHPLLRRRTRWLEQEAALVWARPQLGPGDTEPALALHLLAEPEPVEVETADRRGFAVPQRYRDAEGWHDLLAASGPDCVSGGRWTEAYAYELYCCVRADGELVQLGRDARRGAWELHGSWR
ncbi:MAG TPA: hypothetical protein VFW66_08505 [Gemmatimonadales bacterium]|nr:hypothetical protein [Gemmatimonadales bacterium]